MSNSSKKPPCGRRPDPFAYYWIGNHRVSRQEAKELREEYGEYWLAAKRKEHALCNEMQAATVAVQHGNSNCGFPLKLIVFQSLVHFEMRFGEDWPPLKKAMEAIYRAAEDKGSVAALALLHQESNRLAQLERERVTQE